VIGGRRATLGSRAFRFGVIHEEPQHPGSWPSHLRRVEDLGFSTFLVRDHFVPDFFGDQPAPLVALAHAAALTTHLRVGTMVLAVDYRHPVMLAKVAATLDLLSGGRLELGLGAGWLRREYESAGLTFDSAGTRIDRLEETVRILDGLFGDGPFSFAGKHYTVTDLDGHPKPAQRPRPPLLIGGGRRRVLTLAGRTADIAGILTTSVATGTVVDGVHAGVRVPPGTQHRTIPASRSPAGAAGAPPGRGRPPPRSAAGLAGARPGSRPGREWETRGASGTAGRRRA
jgi:probable F420-dependent oxidoreductase